MYTCSECDFESLKLIDPDEHYSTDHDKVFECQKCDDTFLSEIRLKMDKRKHEPNSKINTVTFK